LLGPAHLAKRERNKIKRKKGGGAFSWVASRDTQREKEKHREKAEREKEREKKKERRREGGEEEENEEQASLFDFPTLINVLLVCKKGISCFLKSRVYSGLNEIGSFKEIYLPNLLSLGFSLYYCVYTSV